ncbi:MAG: hypothetical protein NT062_27130, partial [Proteobacteria bacterium]|nr:hypothetical protein [Pseudomonadota bacterium]
MSIQPTLRHPARAVHSWRRKVAYHEGVVIAQLYQAIQLLRDQPTVSWEEIADAAIWATQALGGEWLERVVDAPPREALDLLLVGCVAARTVTARKLRGSEVVEFLRSEAVGEALAIELTDCWAVDEAWAALARATLPRLRELTIRGFLDLAEFGALLAGTPLATVERLAISGTSLGDEGAALLAHTDALPALRSLEFGETSWDASGRRMSLAGLTTMVNGPAMRGLRGWQVGASTPNGFAAVIARGTSLANLRGIR